MRQYAVAHTKDAPGAIVIGGDYQGLGIVRSLGRRGIPLTTVHRRNIVFGMVVSGASTFLVARSGTTVEAVAGISGAIFFIHFAGTSGWGYVQTVSPSHCVASLSALQNFASFMIASGVSSFSCSADDRFIPSCTSLTVIITSVNGFC